MRAGSIVTGVALLVTIGLVVVLMLGSEWLVKRPPTYESQFPHTVTVNFPRDNGLRGQAIDERIDSELRASESGFFSGIMWASGSVDMIQFDVDLERTDAIALIEKWQAQGVLPPEVEVAYPEGWED